MDTPETDTQFDRYKKQAEEFGISCERVLEEGARAKEFTRTILGKPFTVYTRWHRAPSKSEADPRTYVVVFTANGANLAEELLRAGLARVHGLMADFPSKEGRRKFYANLEALESKAKSDGCGVHGSRVPSSSGSGQVQPATTAASGSVVPKDSPVNLNSATREELMSLPGIGETYADRIIAARPFASIKDVQRVDGIGPKTFEAIAPLIKAR